MLSGNLMIQVEYEKRFFPVENEYRYKTGIRIRNPDTSRMIT